LPGGLKFEKSTRGLRLCFHGFVKPRFYFDKRPDVIAGPLYERLTGKPRKTKLRIEPAQEQTESARAGNLISIMVFIRA